MNTKIYCTYLVWSGFALLSLQAQPTTLPIENTSKIEKLTDEFQKRFPQVNALVTSEALQRDTTVVSVLKRNALNWQNMAIVCDWTESMYVHGIQVLYWLKYFTDNEHITKWVFFNDGDTKQQGEKVVGQTGGIYPYRGSNFDEIIALMQQVKQAGDGGDAPENDLEALLFAQNYFVGVKHWVLIADAQSEIRDMLLLNQLARQLNTQGTQLHILLCGEQISYDYLYLAQVCNASLHTSSEDWENLGNWQEGQVLQLNGTSYTFQQGYFKKLNTTKRKRNK